MRRLFVAVALDDEARHALASQLDSAVATDLPGLVVRPVNWHLTLRFVGDVDDPTVDRIIHALDDSALGSAFRVRLGRFGAFPTMKRAQVLWVGVESGDDDLAALAGAVNAGLEEAGVEVEDRPFRPHLTIARLRPVESVADLIANAGPIDIPLSVERVTLYESRLRRGGAEYEVVEEFPLSE